MKQYIFSALCLVSGAFCLSSCNDDKEARPYTPDYEIVPEYTNADTWKAYEAFNEHLLDQNKFIYKSSTADKAAVDRWNGAAAIWCQPTYWDMAMNAYKRAKAEGDTQKEQKFKQLCDDLFAGNKAHYANFDFDDNNENTGWFIYDDIMWWTVTLARAYELFGVEEYLSLSEESFGRVWYGSEKVGDTGSYADPEKGLGGGMFWQWQPIKNEQYLAKGKEIYAWAVENLVDVTTGQVADSRHGNGNPAWKDHVYNQASYIGASVLLYKATGEKQYLDNAVMAADYTMNTISGTFDLLPFETGAEQGIYTAVFAQYIAMLVYDCDQTQYIPFVKRNINYGWANRDKTRDICGGDYTKLQVEGDAVESYSASGIPALMLLFPTDK